MGKYDGGWKMTASAVVAIHQEVDDGLTRFTCTSRVEDDGLVFFVAQKKSEVIGHSGGFQMNRQRSCDTGATPTLHPPTILS